MVEGLRREQKEDEAFRATASAALSLFPRHNPARWVSVRLRSVPTRPLRLPLTSRGSRSSSPAAALVGSRLRVPRNNPPDPPWGFRGEKNSRGFSGEISLRRWVSAAVASASRWSGSIRRLPMGLPPRDAARARVHAPGASVGATEAGIASATASKRFFIVQRARELSVFFSR